VFWKSPWKYFTVNLNAKISRSFSGMEKMYSLLCTVTHDTKIREFRYKLLNDIVFTNDKLFRFKMICSPLRQFLSNRSWVPWAILFHCDVTKSFWQLLFPGIIEQRITSTSLTLENVIFGVCNVVEDFHYSKQSYFC